MNEQIKLALFEILMNYAQIFFFCFFFLVSEIDGVLEKGHERAATNTRHH